MVEKQSFFILGLILALLSGCVSKRQYLELESNHLLTRGQLYQKTEKITDMELRLKNSEKSRDICSKDLADLQAKYDDLESLNINLSRNVDNLKLDLEKSKSTIQHQKMVIRQLDETKRRIETSLKEEIAAQRIKVEEIEGKLKVTFIDKIFFNAGSMKIKDRGKELLLEIAEALRESNNQKIIIEGHTDNVPIGEALKERFSSNWELSTARASAVVSFLQEEAGLDPERLSAHGYSYYHPVESNDTKEGRHQNRRIEIILAPLP